MRPIWATLRSILDTVRPTWTTLGELGPPWDHFGANLRHIGANLRHFVIMLGHLEVNSKHIWDTLSSIWVNLEPSKPKLLGTLCDAELRKCLPPLGAAGPRVLPVGVAGTYIFQEREGRKQASKQAKRPDRPPVWGTRRRRGLSPRSSSRRRSSGTETV